MSLDDLINEKSKKQKIREQEQRNKREQETERYNNIAKFIAQDLPKLKLFEASLWQFAEKLASLINKKVEFGRKYLFGIIPLSSIKTKDYEKRPCYPKLTIFFESTWHNVVTVSAKEGVLHFRGEYYNSPTDSLRRLGASTQYFAKHDAELNLTPFQLSEAQKWLEDQFVNYYNKLKVCSRL